MAKSHNRKRVTLADVAERAGVSVATVSLILSAREGWIDQFRPETIEAVRRAADRLGYRTNLFASGLPTQGSLFFALVLAGIEYRSIGTWHHWGFEGALLAGVIEEATKRGVYSILATADAEADKAQLQPVFQIIEGGVFGSIVRTPSAVLERFLRARAKRGQRVVVVFPGRLDRWPVNAIDVDNRAVGETVGRLLAARNRKRWVLIRYRSRREYWNLRIAGVERVAEEVGASLQHVVVPTGLEESDLANILASRLHRLKPDGLFAIDSVSAAGSALAAHRSGMRVAQDLDLIGCDCSAWRIGSLPTMTAVDVSWNDVGVLALRQLMSMCQSGESEFDTILMQPRIVPGDTCPLPENWETPTAIAAR